MDSQEIATTLFTKLYAIKELGPGQRPIDLDRARVTLKEWAEHGDSCIREEAQGALRSFETWFSARKWNRGKDRGCFAESSLVDAISKLCDAIDTLGQREEEGAVPRSTAYRQPA